MSALEQVTLDMRPPEVIIRAMITSDRAIDDYLDDLRRRRYSERTLNTYRRILNELADRLPPDLDVSKITIEDVRRYLAAKSRHKRSGKANAIGTVAHAEAVLAGWFKWLRLEGQIARNPMETLARTRRVPADELEVVTVDTADVPRLLAAARPGTERNTIALGAYIGARRAALAGLRLTDYDLDSGTLLFREKGAKAIEKPAPAELVDVLNASIARGEIKAAPEDYLIPPEGPLSRAGVRDDRVVWRVTRRVAERAGIDCHVHALRAAFACFYLERNPDDLLGVKELLGHRSLNTTMVYLRRLNKRARMERVRTLSWASVETDERAAWLSQSPPTMLAAPAVMGAGGFEPPLSESSDPERSGREQPEPRLLVDKRLDELEATREREKPGR